MFIIIYIALTLYCSLDYDESCPYLIKHKSILHVYKSVFVLQSGEYHRIEQSNFPGQYDYTCSSSRVLWGCVITVHSLGQAKAYCNNDLQCRAFVLFTSNPDGDCQLLFQFILITAYTVKYSPSCYFCPFHLHCQWVN